MNIRKSSPLGTRARRRGGKCSNHGRIRARSQGRTLAEILERGSCSGAVFALATRAALALRDTSKALRSSRAVPASHSLAIRPVLQFLRSIADAGDSEKACRLRATEWRLGEAFNCCDRFGIRGDDHLRQPAGADPDGPSAGLLRLCARVLSGRDRRKTARRWRPLSKRAD
jgi:hypothetical protein